MTPNNCMEDCLQQRISAEVADVMRDWVAPMQRLAPLAPASPLAMDCLAALAERLLQAPDSRRFPELMALGFWLRPAQLQRMLAASSLVPRQNQEHDQQQAPNQVKILTHHVTTARGLVFHIAPSNVDTIFLYSWVLALLAGNLSVVRLPSQPSDVGAALLNAVKAVLTQPAYAAILQRTLMLRYPSDSTLTAALSAVADVRVIWGGDDTVQRIRAMPSRPTAVDIAFPNKTSLALIVVSAYADLDDTHRAQAVKAFVNDAYWFDQMACSSPRYVFWWGEQQALADVQDEFWQRVDAELVTRQIHFADADYVNKLVSCQQIAIEHGGAARVSMPNSTHHRLQRIQVQPLTQRLPDHSGAGLFVESRLDDIDDILPLLDRSVQTLTVLGWTADACQQWLQSRQPRGIDRVVPFGRALDFAAVWDGFDLLKGLTRAITVF